MLLKTLSFLFFRLTAKVDLERRWSLFSKIRRDSMLSFGDKRDARPCICISAVFHTPTEVELSLVCDKC